MNTTNKIEKGLVEFLSSPNEISHHDLEQREFLYPWCEEVAGWWELGKTTNWNAPIILPLKLSEENTIWFASALDSRIANQLGIELLAHVGPSFSDFNGNIWEKDSQTSSDKNFFHSLEHNVYRFTTSSPDSDEKIAKYLRLFRGSVQKRPPSQKIVSTSSQLMRSEFDKALMLGDGVQALFLKNELLKSGRLSAENQIYLEVRYLAGLGRSPDLITNEKLPNKLTDRKLPKQILLDLMTSYHAVFVEEIEDGEEPRKKIEEFKSSTRSYGTFFRTRRGLKDPKLLKTFLLYEVCHREIKGDDFEKLASEITDGDKFIQALRDFLSPPSVAPVVADSDPDIVPDQLERANAAFLAMDWDLAFSLCLQLEPTKDTVNKALTCAELRKNTEANAEVCRFIESSNINLDNIIT